MQLQKRMQKGKGKQIESKVTKKQGGKTFFVARTL
jgi:hypothetical protein